MASFTKVYQVQPNAAQAAKMRTVFFATATHAVNVEGKDVVANTWVENDKFSCDLVINGVVHHKMQLGVRGGFLRTPKNEK